MIASAIEGLDSSSLVPIVREVLGRTDAIVTSWQVHAIHSGGGGAGVARLTGTAIAQGNPLSWSVIHKRVRPTEGSTEPTSLRYWAREPLAYRSQAIERLPAGLATPRCYEIEEAPGPEFRLWLEDVGEDTQRWQLERFRALARQLGRFNASYLSRDSLPEGVWLNHAFLRSWIVGTDVQRNVESVRELPDLPRVRRWYPGDMRDRLLRLWDERDELIGLVEALPRTLCHHDAFHRNVLVRRNSSGGEQFVLVDWAFVGTGALGEELAALVSASVALFGANAADVDELDRLAFESYLAGLRDAGWRGDPRVVRYAYAASSAIRFGLPFVVDLAKGSSDPWVEQVVGRPMHEIVPCWVGLRRYLFRLADEARALLPAVA